MFPKSSIKRTALLLLTFSLVLALAPVPAAHAATITVTTNADSGAGSLRQAIADAAVGDTITFGGDMTITLSSQLTISKSLTIDGQIHQVIVSGNHAVRVFSVMAAAGTVTFNHLTIADGNVATYDCGPAAMRCGGGIMIQDMSLTVNVINSILSGNVSPLGEGGGITNWGTLNVINSTFIGNSALARGGAIDNIFGTVNVINSTFSGNSALSYGGGIDSGGIVNVINSTFSGNSAPAAGGGGIYSPHNTATVRNSIMANNNGGNCYGTFDGANNLANDDTCGAGFTNSLYILLGTLGNYGGGTPTFPLLPGSTAIDAGDDTVCAADPVNGQDQRGVARPQGAHCDIGAFESRGFTLTKAGGDNQSTPISTTFTLPLSVTLSETGGNALSGASITFAAPNSGASLANPTTTVLTTNAAGSAARTATANGLTGSYTVTASAPGAVSATFALTNLKGTSNTSVTSSPNPSTFGQAVTFTVTVTSTAGTPTGNITFTLDTTNITQPLVNGVATYVTNTLALGTHAAIAAYGGDANYTESTSSVYPHTVNKFSTTTNVTSAPNPSVSGHPVMITATVTSASGTPTGNITFTIGTANIVQPLVNGLATYVTNTLGLGATPITATYGGDADYNGSVSNNYTHFVDPTLIVTTDADSGPRSLRQAISDALPGDTVTFAGDYTITLSSTLTIAKDLTIDGVGHAITIDGNHAVGVFALNSGTITLNRLNIVNGYLVGTAFPWTSGGGISVDGATLNLSNSTFSGNVTGPLGGGALHLQRGTVNITNSVFISNSSSLGGGAIESESGTTLNVANSTFHGNTATNGGGGIYNSGSSNLTLTNVTFFSNTAQWGGGMYNLTSDPMLTNVTFSANSADQGGGMFNIVSRPLLTNVTFSGNSAAQGGGGMYNTSSRPSMRNSLFWGDSGGEILNIYYTAAISDSVVQGGCPANSTCTNIISADPLLGTLGNYTCPGGQCQGGGSTATIPLLPGSSAIDAGNGAYCTVGSDQRGKNYVGLCDIGAFESQGFTLGALTGTPQSTLINTAFAQPLGLSVTSAFSEPVAGGVISFTAPTSGASLAAPTTFTKTIGASGAVSATVVANGTSGSYTVTASARGATSINFALTNKWVTTTTLTSSPNPSTLGQAVTFTATVTAAVGTPTGSITFTLDATTLTVPLDANGQAAYITNTLSLGNHLVSAAYGGDANFNASSGVLSGGQTVTDVPITNLSAVNSSPTRLRNLTYFTATTGTGSNVTYQWNLGNGHLANGATTSYTYPLTGTYTAIVTATNNFGFSTATTLVAIEPIRVFLPLILK